MLGSANHDDLLKRIARDLIDDYDEELELGIGDHWNPATSRVRRQTVERPFGTIKHWMGATHFLTKTLARRT
jgi:hypothetical protein